MADRIRIRAVLRDGMTDVTVLMPHPMETGLRRTAADDIVPAHHITALQISLAGRTVLSAALTMAVSRDPLLSLRLKGGRAGERLRVSWRDNLGGSRSDDVLIVEPT